MISNAGYLTDMAKDSSENALKVFPFVFFKVFDTLTEKVQQIDNVQKEKKFEKPHQRCVW